MSNPQSGYLARRSQDRRSSRPLSKTLTSGRIRSSAVVTMRPVAPPDVAQARYFEDILRAEILRLRDLERAATLSRAGGSASASTDLDADIKEARRLINEVDRLIRALRYRFPQVAR